MVGDAFCFLATQIKSAHVPTICGYGCLGAHERVLPIFVFVCLCRSMAKELVKYEIVTKLCCEAVKVFYRKRFISTGFHLFMLLSAQVDY